MASKSVTEEKPTARRTTSSSASSRRPPTQRKRESTTDTESASKGVVIGAAAAAGLIAGLAANLGRKVAVQAVSASAGDWLETLKTEHKLALKLFDQLEGTTPAQTSRRAVLLTQLKHALAKHAFEEENTVYPALRDTGENADADGLNHDHGYVKQYLYDLDTMPKDGTAWLSRLATFRTALEKHIREEEDDIFPRLRERLNEEQNHRLTTAMNREGFKLA